MGNIFLRALAFLLGIKYKTPRELEKQGGILLNEILLRKLRTRINLSEVENIWLIGAIPYSAEMSSEIQKLHQNGKRYEFNIPTDFEFKKDYMDFYQVTTKTRKYYLFGMSDTFCLNNEDDVVMFLEIELPYSTSNLNQEFLCYSG